MKKEKKPLNSIALLFFMIIGAVILTYLIPAGAYVRTEINGKMAVDPASFAFVDNHPATPFDIFLAIPAGMTNSVSLLIAALLIGGGLECIQALSLIHI